MYSGALRSVRKLDKTIQIAAAQAKQGARYDGSKSLFNSPSLPVTSFRGTARFRLGANGAFQVCRLHFQK
jgi:hypothetical protein